VKSTNSRDFLNLELIYGMESFFGWDEGAKKTLIISRTKINSSELYPLV
jgi:hypothetical protein